MLDTMTITKISAGVFGAWLILLLGKWAAEGLYTADTHGEASYVIEVESAGEAEPAEEVDFAAILAEADADKGAKVFKKCSACHKVDDGANGAGPHLYGIVDRNVGAADGFGYSGKLAAAADVWTPENLNKFLANPKGFAPGTSMGFSGLKKIEDRANVIAYLQSVGG